MPDRPYHEGYNEGRYTGVVTDAASLAGKLDADTERARNRYDLPSPRTPKLPSSPKSLGEAIRSGIISGAILAAAAACVIIGPQHLSPILKWALLGAAAGAAFVIVVRVLTALLEAAFKVIGWALLVVVALYFLGVFDKIH